MTTDLVPVTEQRPPKRSVVRAIAFLVFVLALAAGAYAWLRPTEPEMPVLATLPPFELTDQTGAKHGSAQLQGRVWVADFIFTRCPTICPKVTAHLHQVQDRTRDLGPVLKLVSFSVDPEHDTPEVLATYAKNHGADPQRWVFLTGDLEQMKSTIVSGFKVGFGKDEAAAGGIFHGTRFVLVDPELNIRGYYDSDGEAELDQLIEDARRLARKLTATASR